MNNLKVGDRVQNIYTKETGTVIDCWDGKYTCSYYEEEQYNPYRITIQLDNSEEGPLANGTILSKAEHLKLIKAEQLKLIWN